MEDNRSNSSGNSNYDSRAAFTYEPFTYEQKLYRHHTHLAARDSEVQFYIMKSIPHSRMLARPYERSQAPIRPGVWRINSSRGKSRR